MKLLTLLFLLFTGAFAQSNNQDDLHVLNSQCFFNSTDDLSSFCSLQLAAQSSINQSILLGLHYGDGHSSELVVELLRADITPEKLERFASSFTLAIQKASEDFDTELRTLEPKVDGNKIVFSTGEQPKGFFYISSVLVSPNNAYISFEQIVKGIFGKKALAVIASKRR